MVLFRLFSIFLFCLFGFGSNQSRAESSVTGLTENFGGLSRAHLSEASLKSGPSWNWTDSDLLSSTEPRRHYFGDLAFSDKKKTLYVVSGNYNFSANERGAIFLNISRDFGKTWDGPKLVTRTPYINFGNYAEKRRMNLIVGANGTLFLRYSELGNVNDQWKNRVLQSFDDGDSWKEVSSFPKSFLNELEIRQMFLLRSGTIILNANFDRFKGVVLKINEGQVSVVRRLPSWGALHVSNGRKISMVSKIRGSYQIIESNDEGTTWGEYPISLGVENAQMRFPVLLVSDKNEYYLAGNYDDSVHGHIAIFKTVDLKNSWEKVAFLASGDGPVFGATVYSGSISKSGHLHFYGVRGRNGIGPTPPSLIFSSRDKGKSWEAYSKGYGEMLHSGKIATSDQGHVFSGSNAGFRNTWHFGTLTVGRPKF